MADQDGPTDLDEDGDEVESLIDSELVDEYEISLDNAGQRRAEFGSLMVSMRIVSNEMENWIENGHLPESNAIDEKRNMISEALKEAPLDDLNPDSSEYDQQITDIVEYAEELVNQLDNLRDARRTLDEAHDQITYYEQQYELFRED